MGGPGFFNSSFITKGNGEGILIWQITECQISKKCKQKSACGHRKMLNINKS